MPLLDHLTITVDDMSAADEFYAGVLGAVGLERVVDLVDEEEGDAPIEVIGWGDQDHVLLWIVLGINVTSNLHLSFWTDSQADVETFYQVALRHGGISQRIPRRWAPYRHGRYSAAIADPWGNTIEVVSPEA